MGRAVVNGKPEDAIMPFGKFAGSTLGDILADEPAYLDWLSTADIRSASLKAAVDSMCEKYSAEIERAIED